MTASRDVDRRLRAYLEDGPIALSDRTYDAVRARIDASRQRVVIGPWSEPRMSNLVRLAIVAAAVVVVAIIGLNLLPGRNGVGGPVATPTAVPTPAPTPTASPPPTPPAFAFPEAGALAVGRHDMTLQGLPFSFEVPAAGWISNGQFAVDKGTVRTSWEGGFIFWADAADGIFTDPCTQREGPAVGPGAAAIAEAIANVPGTTATGPTDVTVGGYPAKRIVVKIPDAADCVAESFYLWWDEQLSGRYATVLGSTIRVWIIDVDGTLIQIDAETPPGAAPGVGQALEGIVASIQFE